jgi:hypothetical protein
MPATPEVREFFDEIGADMALTFEISIAEAVARINDHWRGQLFLEESEIIFHEDAHYWAMRIYYGDVPDWSPEADRSHWTVRPKPPSDSECWTIGSA